MESFFKSQFKFNRFLLISIGLWPLEINVLQKMCFSLSIFLIFSHIFLQVGTLIVALKEGDIDVILESVPYVLIDCTISVNIILWLINLNKIKNLFERLYCTWEYFLPEERYILEKYAFKSRKFTVSYALIIYGILVPFMLLQFYLIFNDSFPSTKETTIHLLFTVKNFLNIGKYYYFTLAMTFFSSCAVMSAFVALDTIFIIFIQHACGMFAILIQRLQNITGDDNFFDKQNANKKRRLSRKIVTECLTTHQTIIEFSDLVNSAFSFRFLLSVTIMTAVLSFTSFCTLEYRNTLIITIRFMTLTSVLIFHLFNKFWQCQTLIDHSILFRNSIYNSNWYNLSRNAKKILYIMLIRSEKLCKVTGGKFFDMSFLTFVRILSTAASYFAVLVTVK